MNTELRKKAKIDFEKCFFKMVNKTVLGKSTKNVRKDRDIKLAIKIKIEGVRNYLVS